MARLAFASEVWLSIYHELVSLANTQQGPDSAVGVCVHMCVVMDHILHPVLGLFWGLLQ